jgi:DNA-binding CsgD family transcriptional regulator/predicted negative regulator of RcsB-dependent stress response
MAAGHNNIGALAAEWHDLSMAENHYGRSLEIKKGVGDDRSAALTMANLADVYTQQGRYEDARTVLREAQETAEGLKDAFLGTFILINLGENRLGARDWEAARSAFDESYGQASRLGIPRFRALAASGRGQALVKLGHRSDALERLQEARSLAEEAKDEVMLSEIDEAYRSVDGSVRPDARLVKSSSLLLAEREKEVLRHLASGESNLEISSALNISLGTAQRHVANMFRKLGVHNRVQAIRAAKAAGYIE